MKKLIGLIAVLIAQGASVSLAQSNNLESIHNYKRPASKVVSQKTQTTSYVMERSTSNFARNNVSNYKIPHYFNAVPLNLLSSITATGIGSSHVNYKQPFIASSINDLEQNSKADSIALKKKVIKPEIQNDNI